MEVNQMIYLVVGNDNNRYVLTQQDLSIFPYTRKDLIDLDPEYTDDEIFRLEDIKANFDKTPPIPRVMECTELLQQKNLVMIQY